MELTGIRVLAASPQQTWDALNNPDVLRRCVAGCEQLEPDGDNRYRVAVGLRIGPLAARFNGFITLSELNPPHGYTLNFDGQGGVAGFGKGRAQVTLKPLENGGCELGYTVQAQVGGKIAQIGQRLVDSAAQSLAQDFFQRFEALVSPAPAEEAATGATVVEPDKPQAKSLFRLNTGWFWGATALLVLGAALAVRAWLR